MTTAGLDARQTMKAIPVPPKRAQRRTFSAEEKYKVLAECDAAEHGQIGGVLRRHGVNRTHLRDWRKQYHEGGMAALAGARKGRPSEGADRHSAQLAAERDALQAELDKFKTLVEIAGKAHELLSGLAGSSDSANKPTR